MEPIFKEFLCPIEENIWGIVVMTTDLIEVEGIPMREEDCLMREDIRTEMEDLQEEEDHKIMKDPLIDKEDPLMEEYPLMVQDPLMMEDPLMEMEDPQDTLIDEDHQDLEDLLDQ